MSAWIRQKRHTITLLKLDFAKSYDMVDWKFIFNTLKARGFGDKWLGWIKLALIGGKCQILVNGVCGNIINSKRALRHDDSLSLLLFILVADSFTKILDLANRNSFLFGLSPLNFNGRLLSL